jgi:hypothetical protein
LTKIQDEQRHPGTVKGTERHDLLTNETRNAEHKRDAYGRQQQHGQCGHSVRSASGNANATTYEDPANSQATRIRRCEAKPAATYGT